MTRRRLLPVGVLLTLLLSLVGCGAPQTDAVTRMDIAVQVAADGSLTVTETFDVSFVSPKHGPYLTFVTLQQTDTAGLFRELDYETQSVTSPTGAPAEYTVVSPSDGVEALQIGSPSTTVTGTQTYVVVYRVTGVMNPHVASSNSDELFWNVIGTGWTIPLSNITVTVTSPVATTATQCWQGAMHDLPCTTHAASGGTAVYTQASLQPGQGLAIVAGWPTGTYTGAEPRHVTRQVDPPPFQLTPATGGVAGGGLVLVLLLGVLLWWRGRDRMYSGLTPGNLPVAGEAAPTTRITHVPYAVRFTPPHGVTPGMVGTLVDKKADLRDVSATLIDLAVRGLVRIEQPAHKDLKVVRLDAPRVGLAPYEKSLLKGLFTAKKGIAGPGVLTGSRFGKGVVKARAELYDAVVQAGWFGRSPEVSGVAFVVAALVVTCVAIFGTVIAGAFGWGLAMIPVVALGGVLLVRARGSAARTAAGSAALSQTLGFKQYLETAEADQLRWEEGEDLFSRYLPYAIAFDCADRWAGVFADLVARGESVPVPSWYVAAGLGSQEFFSDTGVSSLLGSFDSVSTSVSSAIAASTVGSGGGSGFSGSGFAGGGGGGVGGGGGGTW
ncbi:MAG: DUF2207 domain-containing protein [Propionibacteriaceae bacterium]